MTLAQITDEQEETANPETHGLISIMDATGDTKHQWDRHKDDEVAAARATFTMLREKGYLAFSLSRGGEKGEQVHTFDEHAERLLFVPPMRGG